MVINFNSVDVIKPKARQYQSKLLIVQLFIILNTTISNQKSIITNEYNGSYK